MGPLLAKNVGARKSLVKPKPIFLVDAMLGSVARKLRFFGLDTLYIADSPDDEIIRIGIKENRIILTCDKNMYRRIMKVGGRGTLLNGSDDAEDIAQALFSYGIMLSPYLKFNSRCTMCNALLSERTHAYVKGKIPINILNWHSRFFECMNCRKLFWEGSHYMSLVAMSTRIDNRIEELLQENNSYSTDSNSLVRRMQKGSISCPFCLPPIAHSSLSIPLHLRRFPNM